MRILHVVGATNIGGTETWLLQVLRHLDREKYEIDVLVHTTKPGVYDDELSQLGARIIPCLRPSNPMRYARNFRRILREYGPYDCVHCHMHQFTGYVLILAAWMRVPLRIAHSHTDTRDLDRSSSIFRKAYIRLMEFLIQRYATRGLAITESAAASLFSESWKLDLRWSICSTGIELGPFAEPVDPSAVRAELGIHPDAFVVGHVGRFVEVKNHKFLVEIATQVVRREAMAVFLLVGDGPLRPEIEALVRSSGLSDHFVFTGNRKDVPRLMKGAMDCFVFPSIYEGLGRVVWEAQAAGLQCLLTDSIPHEACLSAPLVTRISLGRSARDWANALMETRRIAREIEGPNLKTFEAANIASSHRIIQSIYGEAERCGNRR